MRLEIGTCLRDGAGYEYEVIDLVHPGKLVVRRDDGTERMISVSTIEYMFKEGKIEVMP